MKAPTLPPKPDATAKVPEALAARKMEAARRLWREGLPIAGTVAESYLVGRGIRLAAWPEALRFHPACGRHSASSPDAIERHPALLGLMRDAETGEPLGVHRTFLRPDGADRLRDDGGKMMLGRNGVVMLTEPECVTLGLHVTEGIESGCAALTLGLAPCWAATSAGAIARFPILRGIEALTILADSDDAGIKAARACAARWRGAGREARILRPRREGADINDVARQVAS
ncbi:MAG: toprim domain-containing protein [Rhodospirillales bacterium]|nr:toprim domain-containing protein [Rhodospirillales bacterium]